MHISGFLLILPPHMLRFDDKPLRVVMPRFLIINVRLISCKEVMDDIYIYLYEYNKTINILYVFISNGRKANTKN